MLAQMETGTNHRMKDQKLYGSLHQQVFYKDKRQPKIIAIEKKRKRLELRGKVEFYKKITENHMNYK